MAFVFPVHSRKCIKPRTNFIYQYLSHEIVNMTRGYHMEGKKGSITMTLIEQTGHESIHHRSSCLILHNIFLHIDTNHKEDNKTKYQRNRTPISISPSSNPITLGCKLVEFLVLAGSFGVLSFLLLSLSFRSNSICSAFFFILLMIFVSSSASFLLVR
jgi:hypothetical protein